MASRALLGTGDTVGFGRIADAEIVAHNRFIASSAARQPVQAEGAEPIIINGLQYTCRLGATRAARRGPFALRANH